MPGKDYLRRIEQLLDEESIGTWLDDRTSYDFLFEAAKEFAARTACLTGSYHFKTVANQANYVLPANFLKLFLRDGQHRFFISYSDGSGDTNIYYKDYQDIRFNNSVKTYDIQQGTLTTSATTLQDTGQDFSDWETDSADDNAAYIVVLTNTVGTEFWAYLGAASTTTNDDDTVAVYSDIAKASTGWNGGTPSGTASFYRIQKVSSQATPSSFSIRDKQSLYSQITGTATSDGDATAGECTLTDSSGLFITTDYVNPADIVFNTTDESNGPVLSITSATALKCALFGGTDNEWDSSDAYVIQPQGRLEIYFDPPPSTSEYLCRIDFIKRPNPVYSNYGTYLFREHAIEAIIKYAAFMYKYRDGEPDFGDALFVWWERSVKRELANLNPHLNRRKLKVNFKNR